jgi:hypothetical protein
MPGRIGGDLVDVEGARARSRVNAAQLSFRAPELGPSACGKRYVADLVAAGEARELVPPTVIETSPHRGGVGHALLEIHIGIREDVGNGDEFSPSGHDRAESVVAVGEKYVVRLRFL